MSEFNRQVTPLHQSAKEPLPSGGWIEFEDFPTTIDVLGSLLYFLFQDHWQEVGLGHMVDGSVLELEFPQPPKIIRLYDGYLTVVTEGWHMHLCIEENQGGPESTTPKELSRKRLVSRAALYRRFNPRGQVRSWGIQFWNGAGERMMNVFLPNPFVGENEDLLPENKPDLRKLGLYEQLREIYVQGSQLIPYETNPLKRPFVSVCRSGRCNPTRNWQPIYEALRSAVAESGLEVDVIHSGCLEVCKLGPVVFYSGDKTWYTCVTSELAQDIVYEHLCKGNKIKSHLYPPAKDL
ncbi:(2Fe-2S) ferredoxin domain-containing protein [Leptothermofonsia sp. ETS-13]|uniref:(2Fe-2S) ferredoxin domain-containing protein n=1 Tax=Leptothermofonsia sp. ETS-13 TaxID=3035696 RepID=UPI003B9DF74E